MTPEQEAKLFEERVRQAQATGDIGTLLKLMSQTVSLTPSDYIKKTLGTLMYLYYQYLKYFHMRPRDIEDMIDGLLYISTSNFLDKRAMEDWKSKQRSQSR